MEAPERPEGLDEPLLRGILRLGCTPGDQVGGPERDLLVFGDELRIRRVIASAGTRDQLRLAAGLHLLPTPQPSTGFHLARMGQNAPFPRAPSQAGRWTSARTREPPLDS